MPDYAIAPSILSADFARLGEECDKVLAAGAEVDGGSNDVVGVLTFDRTSDSPVGVFPERRAHERTQAIADVWDNFGFDPATGKAMITAAGITARKYGVDRSETDEIAHLRHQQYFETLERGFQQANAGGGERDADRARGRVGPRPVHHGHAQRHRLYLGVGFHLSL